VIPYIRCYTCRMGEAKHSNHPIRFPDQDWEDLGEAAKAAGSDRSAVIRQFVNWWLRRPLARLPERPPEYAASVRQAPTVHTPPAAPVPAGQPGPPPGRVPFREPEPCPHPKQRVLKGFCHACGTHVGGQPRG